jgi:hypothetical protein
MLTPVLAAADLKDFAPTIHMLNSHSLAGLRSVCLFLLITQGVLF